MYLDKSRFRRKRGRHVNSFKPGSISRRYFRYFVITAAYYAIHSSVFRLMTGWLKLTLIRMESSAMMSSKEVLMVKLASVSKMAH